MKRRSGFTLVEMLTVVAIIGILAAITMQLMVYVNQKTGKTRAARDIEQIKHALTEFKSAYGIYPPTDRMDREYENPAFSPAAPPDEGMGYYDGLTKYLFHDPKSSKWAHYLQGLEKTDVRGHKDSSASYGDVTWSNSYITIHDPWEREYIYKSENPFQSYILYSRGPDGQSGTADDIGSSRFTE